MPENYGLFGRKGSAKMPPKAKFTREEIIAAALEIVREKGIRALTARELGDRLGSSARPIFTVFQNMEEVQIATIEAVKEEYWNFIKDCDEIEEIGLQFVRFAKREPKLFRLLFMTEDVETPQILKVVNDMHTFFEFKVEIIKNEYQLDDKGAWSFYQYFWIYVHGMATLHVTKAIDFAEEELPVCFKQAADGYLLAYKKAIGATN